MQQSNSFTLIFFLLRLLQLPECILFYFPPAPASGAYLLRQQGPQVHVQPARPAQEAEQQQQQDDDDDDGQWWEREHESAIMAHANIQ